MHPFTTVWFEFELQPATQIAWFVRHEIFVRSRKKSYYPFEVFFPRTTGSEKCLNNRFVNQTNGMLLKEKALSKQIVESASEVATGNVPEPDYCVLC